MSYVTIYQRYVFMLTYQSLTLKKCCGSIKNYVYSIQYFCNTYYLSVFDSEGHVISKLNNVTDFIMLELVEY